MGANLNERVKQRAEVAVQPTPAGVEPAAPKTVAQYIRSMEAQFEAAMPRGAEAAQLIRDALTALRTQKNLDQCDHLSVLGALMTCAQLGLRPNVPSLGHAWLLPFKRREKVNGNWRDTWQCQLIMGYQGYRELAQRSGQIASVVGRVAYANDTFDIEYGLEEKLVHKPFRGGPRGEPTDYYAVVKYTNGGYSFWSMSKTEAEEHRDKHAMARKKVYDDQGKATGQEIIVGPWRDEFDTMAVKTAFLKLSKWMPKTSELAAAVAADGTVRMDLTPHPDAMFYGERPDPREAVADIETAEPKHANGHGLGRAWSPDCEDCQGDTAGEAHDQLHIEPEESCTYCAREAAWKQGQP